jgi:hypothetical protein
LDSVAFVAIFGGSVWVAPCRQSREPWPLDFNLATVEADLALRFPPAVRPPVTASRMPWTTDCLRIVIHHLAEGPPSQKPGKTNSKLAEISTGPQASALSSEAQ